MLEVSSQAADTAADARVLVNLLADPPAATAIEQSYKAESLN